MKLTSEEGRSLVYGDLEGWEIIESKITGQRRWMTEKEGIFKHEDSGKHYSLYWCELFEYDDPELTEVKQVEKTVKV